MNSKAAVSSFSSYNLLARKTIADTRHLTQTANQAGGDNRRKM